MEVLPAASVAVFVTVVTPFGNILPEAGTDVTAPPVQLSVKVGAGQVTTAPQDDGLAFAVRFGHALRTGLVISLTFTLNEQTEVLPAGSFAV